MEGKEAPRTCTTSDRINKTYKKLQKGPYQQCYKFGAHQKMQNTHGIWKTLCNIHMTKNLSNFLFIGPKFYTIKMDEGNENTCEPTPMPWGIQDVVMTWLDSVPPCSTFWSLHWRCVQFQSSCWISSLHASCTRCSKGKRRNLNMEHSTITKGAPTTEVLQLR